MNVLFLSLIGYSTIKERDIYTDLLREFIKHGHKVFIVSPAERRQGIKTGLITEDNSTILRVKTGNVQKTNIIEKGISTVMIEYQFLSAIKRYYNNVKFDLILYSTPPITIARAVEYVKKRDNAITYLMLKDIFPQNAVDIGVMATSGLKGLLYKIFRVKEKKLYSLSDHIGCMSQANVDYLIRHNPYVNSNKVEISPNSIDVIDKSVDDKMRGQIRIKYGIPTDKKVLIYGGNLGKPQDIPYIISCLRNCQNNDDIFFLIVGDGTDYHLVKEYIQTEKPNNVKLMNQLPKDDYDIMVGACDIGLIFLDHRFTIPNFPSRLLGYLQAKLPVIAVTDRNTDIGNVIVNGGFGWWCESNSTDNFYKIINKAIYDDLKGKGIRGFKYLEDNWTVEKQYRGIMDSINK